MKKALLVGLLLLFSLGGLAVSADASQRNRNDNRNRTERRENGNNNRGHWRRKHRRHRRHWRKHNM
jgi:hypothetical protein